MLQSSKALPLSRADPSPSVGARPTLNAHTRGSTSPLYRRSSVIRRVMNVDESNFEQEVLKADKAVLVDFWDTWCGPCKLMDPLMAWAEQEYSNTLKVVKIRHDSCPKLIEQYKVYGLPAFLVFKNGELVPGCKKEGAVNQKMLVDYLKQHGIEQ